jgi:RHS repeat-associated protein
MVHPSILALFNPVCQHLCNALYDYDPYGNVTKLSGDLDTDFAYTGHYYHAPSGLHLAPYRGYDPRLGRWLSRDPIEEEGGINLYGYVGNRAVNEIDPLGLVRFEKSMLRNWKKLRAVAQGMKGRMTAKKYEAYEKICGASRQDVDKALEQFDGPRFGVTALDFAPAAGGHYASTFPAGSASAGDIDFWIDTASAFENGTMLGGLVVTEDFIATIIEHELAHSLYATCKKKREQGVEAGERYEIMVYGKRRTLKDFQQQK